MAQFEGSNTEIEHSAKINCSFLHLRNRVDQQIGSYRNISYDGEDSHNHRTSTHAEMQRADDTRADRINNTYTAK